MTKENEAGVELNALAERLEKCALASRVTNALLLAQRMGLDMTEPMAAGKVLRYLHTVERYVEADTGDAA